MEINFQNSIINIHNSWNELFTDEILKILKNIENNIGNDFTPITENIFRVLNNDLSRLKCCILGQDPYPQPGVATGRAFEVSGTDSWQDKKINFSLKNMLRLLHKNYMHLESVSPIKIVREDIENKKFPVLPPDKIFVHWERQGVLLLNTSLTCRTGFSNSHAELWREFTSRLVQFISEKNNNVIWLLWGRDAQRFAEGIPDDRKYKSFHPRLNGNGPGSFFYENHFLKIYNINWV
jgi:uracil-DNA glycosylase